MRAADEHPELAAFHAKLPDILAGRRVELSADERMWLQAFRQAGFRYGEVVTLDESIGICFAALGRCFKRLRARSYRYILTACVNAHKNHIRLRRRGKRIPPDLAIHVDWRRIDERLDLHEALAKIGQTDPQFEAVVRLRMQRFTFAEVAKALGITVKSAQSALEKAKVRIHQLLGAGYE